MKISTDRYEQLFRAVIGVIPADATERERWDALFSSGFPVDTLYNDGLNDINIDAALRKISKVAAGYIAAMQRDPKLD